MGKITLTSLSHRISKAIFLVMKTLRLPFNFNLEILPSSIIKHLAKINIFKKGNLVCMVKYQLKMIENSL